MRCHDLTLPGERPALLQHPRAERGVEQVDDHAHGDDKLVLGGRGLLFLVVVVGVVVLLSSMPYIL